MRVEDISGYEGRYTISECGIIRNRWGNEVKSHARPDGYIQVRLVDSEGKRKSHLHHRLVANAFIANPDGLNEVNHINGDKSDNSVSNLEWLSKADNAKHAYSTGLRARGSKLNETDAIRITELTKLGMTNKLIAQLFGVSRQLISNIKTGRKWASVTQAGA